METTQAGTQDRARNLESRIELMPGKFAIGKFGSRNLGLDETLADGVPHKQAAIVQV